MTFTNSLMLGFATLSLLSSLFILVSYCRFPALRSNMNTVVAALSLSTFVDTVTFIIGGAGLCAAPNTFLGVSVCQLQAFFMVASEVWAANWTTSLSIFVLLTIFRPKRSPVRFRTLMFLFSLFAFLLPLLGATYIWLRDAYAAVGLFCFISCTDPKQGGCLYRMTLFYYWVFLAFGLSLFTMLAVTVNNRRLDRRLNVASACETNVRAQALACETVLLRQSVLSRLRLYLLVYFVAWLPSSILRVMQTFIDPEYTSEMLSFGMCTLCPLMGFGNMLVIAPELVPAWRGVATRDIWGSYSQKTYQYHTNRFAALEAQLPSHQALRHHSGSMTTILRPNQVAPSVPVPNPLVARHSQL
jgi:hypothetical protein